MALVTLAECLQRLNMTSDSGERDALIDSLLAPASAIIEAYCKRTFAQTTYCEVYDGPGGYELMVDNSPIISVTKLSQDIDIEAGTYDELITASEMLVHKSTGIIEVFNETFIKAHKNIYIEYVAGFASVPEDIKSVCMDLIAKKYHDTKDGRFGVVSKSTLGNNAQFNFMDLSDFNKEVLNKRQDIPRREGAPVSQFSAA